MVRITCYDGVGCIGGNKILLEDGQTKLWLDFGLNFGHMSLYYEEYLKPKNCLGLYEPVQMGLLPPIPDLYREDLTCDLVNPWLGIDTKKIGDVHGIILSHAHLDHIGALHYIREDIPIYASAMTAAIAKAMQDISTSGTDNYCYVTPYQSTGSSGELSKALKDQSPKPRQLMLISESLTANFVEFWQTPASGHRNHESIKPTIATDCAGLKARRFPIDHSVYGASAWVIETSAGAVVYTGDLRCHGKAGHLTLKFAEEVGKLKPLALIIEGTRIRSNTTTTEQDIQERALEEVKKSKGLVVADFGPRNVERVLSFLEIAKSTGRKLVLLQKDVYLLKSMSLVSGSEWQLPSLNDPDILVYSEYQAGSKKRWQKSIEEEYSSKHISPQEIAKNQADYICCFSFFDVNELAVIRPRPGSIWIYSSCEPFNEEMRIDFQRLKNWLDKWEVSLLGGEEGNSEASYFHVSGHACQQDLIRLIEMINPQIVIPVHTEEESLDYYANLLEGRFKVIIPQKGLPIEL